MRELTVESSEMMNVYNAPMDYLTMLFCTWNVAVVGVVAIFWKSPLWVQQVYLVLVSAATVSLQFAQCACTTRTHYLLIAVHQYAENATLDHMDSIDSRGDLR